MVGAEIVGESSRVTPWEMQTYTRKMGRWISATDLLIRRKLETGRLAASSLVWLYKVLSSINFFLDLRPCLTQCTFSFYRE